MNLKEHYKQRLNALLEAQVGYDPSRAIPMRPIDGSGAPRDSQGRAPWESGYQPSRRDGVNPNIKLPKLPRGGLLNPRIDGSGAPRDSQGRAPWESGYQPSRRDGVNPNIKLPRFGKSKPGGYIEKTYPTEPTVKDIVKGPFTREKDIHKPNRGIPSNPYLSPM